jgi:hypothetical protein
MIHSRNAQAALLVTFILVAIVAGSLVIASMIFERDPINIADEFPLGRQLPRKTRIEIGTPVPLIPDVTLTFTNTRWSSSLTYRQPSTGGRGLTTVPSNPDLRFLIVDFQIMNGSDKRLSRDGLVSMVDVTGIGIPAAGGMDVEAFRKTLVFSYGALKNNNKLQEIGPAQTYDGTWFFELDSNAGNLKLVSTFIGFQFFLPEDLR